MTEFELLKERWKDAKGTRTFQDIADSVGLSRNTVENAFQRSVNPGIDTVIRISRELNVSIDDVCGIIADSSSVNAAKQDADHWKTRYESSARDNDYLHSVVLFLGVLVLVFAGWAIMMDFRCTEIGLYRGQWTFGTVFSLICLALASAMVVLLVVRTFRRHRQRRRERE